MKPISLRRRLLLWLLAGSVAACLLGATAVYFTARHEVEELYDGQLINTAQFLMLIEPDSLVQSQPDPDNLDGEEGDAHNYKNKVAFQIINAAGAILYRSNTAPPEPMSEATFGFNMEDIWGSPWRVYALTSSDRSRTILVAEKSSIRDEVVGNVVESVVVVTLITIPLLALVAWLAVITGLRPLIRLGEKLRVRLATDFSELSGSDAPVEVSPLVSALNQLFSRRRAAFEKERRFTADASHELRTPLAAIKAHAQVAVGTEERQVRAQALRGIVTGVDRTSHIVQQLLSLARADKGGTGKSSMDILGLCRKVAGELAPLAESQQVAVSFSGQSVSLQVNEAKAYMLVRNLLDNAFRYNRPGGEVKVRVSSQDETIDLAIEDNGVGIADQDLARVFDRFYRVAGTDQSGAGLGLSIVKQISESIGAELLLQSSNPGLKVTVRFPMPGKQ